jgi:MoaA/NifB/PqqE/SkfB family radical SAM enzyme
MKLTGIHLLLTYQCNLECEHCFVWGSPWQSGTMTLGGVRELLRQAKDLGGVTWFYFEGGEPFLYYPVMLRSVQEASLMGFQVGIVSNGYWATDEEDALENLAPFQGMVQDLSISSDLFHWSEEGSRRVEIMRRAAERLDIPVGVISIAQPDAQGASSAEGQLPLGESAVMFRGRAAQTLVSRAKQYSWDQFVECPFENLYDPGRIHVDPLGYMHICQGISLGNIFQQPLVEICEQYDADEHPITGPLLRGGPAELVRQYDLPHDETYADACHLCDQARRQLRQRFPDILTPDQMYQVP